MSVENKKGYCEICSVPFADLKAHCKTKSHQKFLDNKDSYKELDLFVKEFYNEIDNGSHGNNNKDISNEKNKKKRCGGLLLPSSINGYLGWEKRREIKVRVV